MLCDEHQWQSQDFKPSFQMESRLKPSLPRRIPVARNAIDLPWTPSQSATAANISSEAEIAEPFSQVESRLKPPLSEWTTMIVGSPTDLPYIYPSATATNISSGAEIELPSSQVEGSLKPLIPGWIPAGGSSTDLPYISLSAPATNVSSGAKIDVPSSQLEGRLKPPLSEWILVTDSCTDHPCTPSSAATANISAGAEIDEKKRKRRISNRESARRSRIKREKHMQDLINEKFVLERKSYENKHKFVAICERRRLVESENEVLRDETIKLKEHLNYLDKIIGSCKETHDNNVNSNRAVLNPWQVYGPVQSVSASGMFV